MAQGIRQLREGTGLAEPSCISKKRMSSLINTADAGIGSPSSLLAACCVQTHPSGTEAVDRADGTQADVLGGCSAHWSPRTELDPAMSSVSSTNVPST